MRRMTDLVVRGTLVLSLAIAAAGCKEQLHSRVSESDANEMVATLYVGGIRADKVARDDRNWSVEVERDDVQRALHLLQEHGLPHQQFANTGELFKKEGLVSTPSEERIRYMYAVSQELSQTLSQIDGVISARVHLVMPANDPLATRLRPSSASIFIKHRSNANLQALSPAIKNLVRRGIEGLEYENIALTFVAGEEALPLPIKAPAALIPSVDWTNQVQLASAAVLVLVLASTLAFFVGRRRRGTTDRPNDVRLRTEDATAPREPPDWTRAPSMNVLKRGLERLLAQPQASSTVAMTDVHAASFASDASTAATSAPRVG